MAKAKDPGKLSDGEERCVQEYLKNGGNQSKAFRTTFPHSLKWKDESVWQQASKLFSQPKVRSRIDHLQAVAANQAVVTDIELLRDVVNLARSDIRDLMDGEGRMMPPKMWPTSAAIAVKSIQYDNVPEIDKKGEYTGKYLSVVKRVQLYDKLNALEKLFKHLGLYKADNEQKGGFEITGFEALPKEVRGLIVEKLIEIAGRGGLSRPVLDGQSGPVGGSPVPD